MVRFAVPDDVLSARVPLRQRTMPVMLGRAEGCYPHFFAGAEGDAEDDVPRCRTVVRETRTPDSPPTLDEVMDVTLAAVAMSAMMKDHLSGSR